MQDVKNWLTLALADGDDRRPPRNMFHRPRLTAALTRWLAVGISLALAGFASAATYYVSPTGNNTNPGTQAKPLKTIQTALDKSHSGDTIILENGTYTGAGDVDLAVGNTTVTIESLNGAASTIIECAGSTNTNHAAFAFSSCGTASAPVVLQGLTIKDAYTQNSAVSLSASDLSLSSVEFINNNGGALLLDSKSVASAISCSFTSNVGEYGGAANSGGSLSFTNCTLQMNSAYEGAAVCNGGGYLSFQGCTITLNSTSFGGAVYNNSGVTEMSGCTVSNNTASQDPSGLCNVYGTCSVQDCLFSGNSAPSSWGGAFYTDVAQACTFANCIFANNSAEYGGGVYANSNVTLIGCTFSGNSASTSGGGGAIYVDNGAIVNLEDDILWGDTAPLASSTEEIANHGTLFVTYSDVQLGWSGAGNLKANPLFLSASAGDYLLSPTTPCLHAGKAVSGLTTDYAGRIRNNPPTMGAYEAGSLWSTVASIAGGVRLYSIPKTGTATYVSYNPPVTGSIPVGLSVGPDNHAYLVWQDPTGTFEVWNIGPSGTTTEKYTPGAAWFFVSITVGPDSYVHLQWENKPGELWIWSISPTGSITYATYGPFN